MSSTNKTTNLELSQFIGSDSPKWLTDYNADMEKIDAGYQTVKAQADATDLVVGGHTSSISTLQDTTTSQGTAITGLRTDVNGNSGSINTINSLIGNGEPTTQDKTLIGAINELNGKLTNKVLISPQYTVSVKADGTETLGDLVKRLHTAVNNVIHGLNTGAQFIPLKIFSSNYGALPCRYAWSKYSNVDTINIEASVTFIASNNGHIATHQLFSDGNNGYATTNDNGTTTDDSAVVPKAGDTLYFDYRLEYNA